jgi:hypothetical protein
MRRRSAADLKRHLAVDPQAVPEQVLAEVIRRVREIEASYRDVAQKMGQLYMYADQHELGSLTRNLDRPMRNASDNERVMVSILDELQLSAGRRPSGGH